MLEKINRLWSYLLRRKRYFVSIVDGTLQPELWLDGFRRPEYVVPRSRCYYRLFDLGNVKREFRDSALALQVRKWSPVDSYHQCVIWSGNQAEVWITSRDNIDRDDAVFLPESLFVGRANDHSEELVAVVDGVEGRIWEDGVLQYSKFWEDFPTISQWHLFLRGGSHKPQALPIKNADVEYTAQPWRDSRSSFDVLDLPPEKTLVIATCSIFVCILTWQLTQSYLWQKALDGVNREYQQTSNTVGVVLEARSKAQRYLLDIHAFNALQPANAVLSLMARISALITEEGAYIEEFSQSAEQVFVRIRNTEKELTTYVESLERDDAFKDAKATWDAQRSAVLLSIELETP